MRTDPEKQSQDNKQISTKNPEQLEPRSLGLGNLIGNGLFRGSAQPWFGCGDGLRIIVH